MPCYAGLGAEGAEKYYLKFLIGRLDENNPKQVLFLLDLQLTNCVNSSTQKAPLHVWLSIRLLVKTAASKLGNILARNL